GHDVYFGTDFNDVTDANVAEPCGVYCGRQDSNKYPEDGDPLLDLDLMTTYYWRVDEINDTNTWTGPVWSFTTEDGNARDPEPVDGFIGQAPSANVLSWTPSCVAATQDVYFSTNFDDVNTMPITTLLPPLKNSRPTIGESKRLEVAATAQVQLKSGASLQVLEGFCWICSSTAASVRTFQPRNPTPAATTCTSQHMRMMAHSSMLTGVIPGRR
ncbi:MAG: hypothetical protein ACYSUC_09635, partial [Planctomycetota bacterium]